MAEFRIKYAYATLHRVWSYDKQAPSSELVGGFCWTHAAHDLAKVMIAQDQPKGVMYVVTELDDGKQTWYRKDQSDESGAQG